MPPRPLPSILTLVIGLTVFASSCGNDLEPAPRRGSAATTTTLLPVSRPEMLSSVDGLGDPMAPLLGNGGYDVTDYELALAWNPETLRMTGTAEITATAPEGLDAFNLDATGFTVQSVTVDNQPADFRHEDPELQVTPQTPVPSGEFVVRVDYVMPLDSFPSTLVRSDVGWVNAEGGAAYVRSEPDGAHTWFPANDHPLDKARFTVIITVPDTMIAFASGALARTERGVDTTTYRWDTGTAVAPHTMTAGFAQAALVTDEVASGGTGIRIRHVLPPDLADKPPAALAKIDDIIAFLEQRYGRFPYKDYGVVVVDGQDLALPTHTWSIVTRQVLQSDDAELRLAADIGRHWFGDSVAVASWSDVWLSTAFGTYSSWMWLQRNVGLNALELTAKGARAKVKNSVWPPPDAPVAGDIYSGSVFLHGAITLHAMRLKMGDQSFFGMLQAFHTEHEGGNASTADFLDAVADAGGGSLLVFVDAWLHNDSLPGFPQT